MDQSTVLIISDEKEFSQAITRRWRSERDAPLFILRGSDECEGLNPGCFDLAILGGLSPAGLPGVIQSLQVCGKSAFFVKKGNQPGPPVCRQEFRLGIIAQTENWLESTVLVGAECLRASQALARIQKLERDAALGRFMLDSRHGLNNALTSVLGNSELLLLTPEDLSPRIGSQIETIRNMSLRIHEIMQRFSSLEKEMNIAEQQSVRDDIGKARAATAL